MELRTLESLFEDQLRDLYSAEIQLIKALPKMAKRAESESLREAFETHLEETREQVERLKQIGEELGIKLGGKKCVGMEGILEEGEELFDMEGEGPVIDAALIGAAQRVEHYEISGYGTARAIAEQLGHEWAAGELQRTLDEESATDEKLTRISVGQLLPAAGMGMGEELEMEGEEEEETMEAAGRAGMESKGRKGTGRSTTGRTRAAGRSAGTSGRAKGASKGAGRGSASRRGESAARGGGGSRGGTSRARRG